MSTGRLPDEENVAKLLTSLLGEDVTVKLTEETQLLDLSSVKAFYVNDQGHPQKLLVCDLPFANSIGAALTRIPLATVEEANAALEVPQNIYENLYEVLNICVNVFPAKSNSHIVLGDVITPGQDADGADTNAIANMVTFEVDIPRYGVGLLGLAELTAAVESG